MNRLFRTVQSSCQPRVYAPRCPSVIIPFSKEWQEMQFSASTGIFANPFCEERRSERVFNHNWNWDYAGYEIKGGWVDATVFHLACFKLENTFKSNREISSLRNRSTCNRRARERERQRRHNGWAWKGSTKGLNLKITQQQYAKKIRKHLR